MPLLKPEDKPEKTLARVYIYKNILDEIEQYCQYSGFKKVDQFFEQAASYVMNKDKEFKEWKESQKK